MVPGGGIERTSFETTIEQKQGLTRQKRRFLWPRLGPEWPTSNLINSQNGRGRDFRQLTRGKMRSAQGGRSLGEVEGFANGTGSPIFGICLTR